MASYLSSLLVPALAGFPQTDFLFRRHLYLFAFLCIVGTPLEISLPFDVFLEPIEDIVLPELVPVEVDAAVVGVVLLEGPPGSIRSENIFDEPAVVPLADIEHVGSGGFGHLDFDVVGEVY